MYLKPSSMLLAIAISMLMLGTTFVEAVPCDWSTDLSALRVSGKGISIAGGMGYELKKDPKVSKLFQSVDPNDGGKMSHQVIFTDTVALVTNSQSWKGMPFVFKFEFNNGEKTLYATQERMGTGTCDLSKPGLTPSSVKSITAYLASQ